jgi:hypothetical protein
MSRVYPSLNINAVKHQTIMRTLPEKLGIRSGQRIVLRAVPHTIEREALTGSVQAAKQLRGTFDTIIAFVTSIAQLERSIRTWQSHLSLEGRLWICWPKGDVMTELNIKTVISIGYRHGMVESNAIRIDAAWSALKFMHPKAGKEYHNSYGELNHTAVHIYRR